MSACRLMMELWTAATVSPLWNCATRRAGKSADTVRALQRSVRLRGLLPFLLLSLAPSTQAATRYVAITSTSPASPFLSWETAATNIQDAIDVSVSNDTVLVSNGVYGTGGRVMDGSMTNRVAATNGITVRSVNGPGLTFIEGAKDPFGTTGDAAVRCVYLGGGAVLSGFTLTNGATRSGGDAFYEQSGGGLSCRNAVVSNCVITGNSAYYYGGGAMEGVFYSCTFAGNEASHGGGAAFCTLNNSLFAWNLATGAVGGYGGSGGGARDCLLNNCTLLANSAVGGGGSQGGSLRNCIVYYNVAAVGPNHNSSTLSYCCTTPDPGGTGNFTNEPMVTGAANPHLLDASPCINAGSDTYATGVDLDGEPRITMGSVDVGCDEYTPPMTGFLSLQVKAVWTNIATEFAAPFEAQVAGRPDRLVWRWGDGHSTTNLYASTHAFTTAGVYQVILEATNASDSASATVGVQVAVNPTYYVAPGGGNSPPFTNWFGAAWTIQAAVDAAAPGGTVWVSNGVYDSGGRVVDGALTNRVVVDKPLIVRSVNGALGTVIRGHRDTLSTNAATAVRCAYLGKGVTLDGFTLTNGMTLSTGGSGQSDCGGGAWCEGGASLLNCLFAGNAASVGGGGSSGGMLRNCTFRGNAAAFGGGSYNGTLLNCLFEANYAAGGGGSYGDALHNCTLSGNSASGFGGGALYSTLKNCIVYFNSAFTGENVDQCSLSNCCTSPNPGGTGNITNDPQFVEAMRGNFRLMSGSPCIDAGNNELVQTAADIDGKPRIRNGTVDLGAYESGYHFVAITSTNPVAPYSSWTNAATNIQDAIDVALSNDTVLVSNGVYATGTRIVYGAMMNRIAITNAVAVRSVNGPEVTCIVGAKAGTNNIGLGDSAVRVVFACPSSSLSGFTLTNGATRYPFGDQEQEQRGGTVWCEDTSTMLSNCVLTGGSALTRGGGAYRGTLVNCQITGNAVMLYGGGVASSVVHQCVISHNSATLGGGSLLSVIHNSTIDRNSASEGGGSVGDELRGCRIENNVATRGGGVSGSTIIDCIVVSNFASEGGGCAGGKYYNSVVVGNVATNFAGGINYGLAYNSIIQFNVGPGAPNFTTNATLNNCCTLPMPAKGSGNITNDPQFVDAATGDFHLKTSSPCIDRGNNDHATNSATDLDGLPRIRYGVVDMGAYEFQSPVGYWQWAAAITNGLTNLTDEATGGGYPNLLKYATGGSPTNGDDLAALTGDLSNGVFSLRFNRDTNACDVTLIVEGSDAATNDAGWVGMATNSIGSWGAATNVIEAGTGTPVRVAVLDVAPFGTNRFLRLRVTRP